MKYLIILFLFLPCTVCADPDVVQMQEASAVDASGNPATIDGDPGLAFRFTIGEHKYSIGDNGQIAQLPMSSPAHTSKIRVPSDMWVAGPLYFAQIRDNYLILYQLSSGEDGAGEITLVDGKTLSTKWSTGNIPFNITPGVIVGKYVYVTGIGFIGAIDIDTGKYSWCLKDLYQNQGNIFDAFDVPKIEGNTLSVQDKFFPSYFVKVNLIEKTYETNGPLPKPISIETKCGAG